MRAETAMAAAAVVGGAEDDQAPRTLSTQTYDRVVRIVSWVFLLATTTIVAVTGLWTQQPARDPGPARPDRHVRPGRPRPAAGRCAGPGQVRASRAPSRSPSATLLVALTGGVQSPFFFTYPLIVGGAALVVSPPITVALAATAALGYLLAVVLGSPAGRSALRARAATVGINLTAMILLAYVAMVIAREQRRDARRGDPPLDHRPADRRCSTAASSSPPSSARSPEAPGRGAASAC